MMGWRNAVGKPGHSTDSWAQSLGTPEEKTTGHLSRGGAPALKSEHQC
jgi:hypothetical protein